GYNVAVHDRVLHSTVNATPVSSGSIPNDFVRFPTLSANGRRVAFYSGATNLLPSLVSSGLRAYLRDLDAETTTIVAYDDQNVIVRNVAAVSLSRGGTVLAF